MHTYPLNVHQRSALVIDELSSEFSAFLRVRTHDMLEETDVIRRVLHLPAVQNNLLGLPRLGKARNDFVGDIRAEVHAKREGEVVQPNDVAELFAACELQNSSASV